MEDVQRRKSGSCVGCEHTHTHIYVYIYIASAWVLGVGGPGGWGVAYIYTEQERVRTHVFVPWRGFLLFFLLSKGLTPRNARPTVELLCTQLTCFSSPSRLPSIQVVLILGGTWVCVAMGGHEPI